MKPAHKAALTKFWKKLGRLGQVFLVELVLYAIVSAFMPSSVIGVLLVISLIPIAAWLLLRLLRAMMRQAIWRLRNRLLMTYLFIAVVPILLVAALAVVGTYILVNQLAVYLATSQIYRDIATLHTAADVLAHADPSDEVAQMRRLGASYRTRFPGVSFTTETAAKTFAWPDPNVPLAPAAGWGDTTGIFILDGQFYAAAHVVSGGTIATAAAPLSRVTLSEMVPGLGDVSLWRPADAVGRGSIHMIRNHQQFDFYPSQEAPHPLPPAMNRFDVPVGWIAAMPISAWREPNQTQTTIIVVRTRVSAVLGTIFSGLSSDNFDPAVIVLVAVGIAFLIVEIIALIVGTSLTRTITRAVHELYAGTQNVMQGDFSNRIRVYGRDQLATLSTSFNSMTENLERLVVVAKEKERLQTELEIAQQVQEQLYPKTVPNLKTLRLTGRCEPARMVSGDYYDYQCMESDKAAIAIGDVAGKGISAALLMATIQAALRMELRTSATAALAAPGGRSIIVPQVSTAYMVSELNQQLYATTSPEKYATFYFAIYDDVSGLLTYTNAGHLPPILVRNGQCTRLEVNGTVVGAFPFAKYEESAIQLDSGDLLVCFTDGITEPENEYGEMFGEERLGELVVKNADREDSRIVDTVLDSVRQWTRSPELHDDMTILLARRP